MYGIIRKILCAAQNMMLAAHSRGIGSCWIGLALPALMDEKILQELGACQLNCPTKAIKVENGVGCASAMMVAAVKGQKEVPCGCASPIL